MTKENVSEKKVIPKANGKCDLFISLRSLEEFEKLAFHQFK